MQLAGGESDPHRRDAPLPHARQRHRRAIRQSARDRRKACPATPCSGWKSKGRSTDDARHERLQAAVWRSADAAARAPARSGGVPLGGRGAVQRSSPRWSHRRCGLRRRRAAAAVRARRRIGSVTVEVVSENPQQDAERLLRNFIAALPTGGPCEEAEVQRFLALVQAGVRARLRLRALDARRLHRRAGLAGVRLPRGKAGPARRLGAGHAPVAFPLELRRPTTRCARCAEAASCTSPKCCARETERLLNDPQVAPLRRCLPRLLARPAQDRRHLAVRDALQRLRARRSAQARRARGDAAVLRRTAARAICRRATSSPRISPSSTSGSPRTTASPACRARRCAA